MNMGLTELPFELFRLKNVKKLYLNSNNLCSLPSEIAHLATLETLSVRLSGLSDRDLTLRRVLSGQPQPAHVPASGNRPAYRARDALRAKLELSGS
jgi:Leucine-rich repeat (LRR) protein